MLCYRPQLFTVRTKRLCQLLRLNRTAFLNIVQAHVGDGTIIMNNLLQVCKSCSTSNFPFLLSFLFFFFFWGGWGEGIISVVIFGSFYLLRFSLSLQKSLFFSPDFSLYENNLFIILIIF